MTEQLRLDLEPIIAVEILPEEPIGDRFRRFHAQNPAVYREIVRAARFLKSRGFRHGGMKAIFERIRWHWAVSTRGDAYKLNNDYTAHYARLIMDREPDLAGFFRVRRLRT